MDLDDLESLRVARRMVRLGLARELRRWAGVSQADVAAVIGATHAAVSRWESNNRVPHGEAGVRYGALLRRWHAERAEEAIA